jgi:hypothetical protein
MQASKVHFIPFQFPSDTEALHLVVRQLTLVFAIIRKDQITR